MGLSVRAMGLAEIGGAKKYRSGLPKEIVALPKPGYVAIATF